MDVGTILSSYPFLLALIAFIIGKILMPYILKMAKNKEMIVRPNKRTSHSGGIPNIGGLNIFSSVFLSYFLFSVHNFNFEDKTIIAAMFVMLLIGFFDDMVELRAREKLMGELVVGFILIVVAGIRLTNLHGFLGIGQISPWVGYPLSFFVFLLVINGLNLVDGVDGLASGLGILICIFFGVYFMLIKDVALSMMAFAFVGALLIFFLYNVFGHKSKIFMGDSGALVLGCTIYLFVTKFCEFNAYPPAGTNPALLMTSAPVVSIAVLAIPLIDTLRVMITRLKNKKSPFLPDRNHVHHLMLSTGLRHREVTFILLIVNAFFILLGLLLRNVPIELGILIIIAVAVTLIIILWRIVDAAKQKQNSIS